MTVVPALAGKFSAEVSDAAGGPAKPVIPSTAENIYARWQGHGLGERAKIRVVWVAEDVGDVAPPNYEIDDASTIAAASDSRGTFTLARPTNGWTPGAYRVDLFVNDTPAASIRLKIAR